MRFAVEMPFHGMIIAKSKTFFKGLGLKKRGIFSKKPLRYLRLNIFNRILIVVAIVQFYLVDFFTISSPFK